MFHAAAQYAAAQQECVDAQTATLPAKDHGARETVTPEAVLHLDDEALGIERLNLRFGAPDQRGIHLAGALRELRNARQIPRLHRRNRDFQLQGSEKLLQTDGRPLGAAAFGSLRIKLG